MVVTTRSRSLQNEAATAAAESVVVEVDGQCEQHRRVRIQTPSFRDASIHTYKIYWPVSNNHDHDDDDSVIRSIRRHCHRDVEEAANAIIALSEEVVEPEEEEERTAAPVRINHVCINPMRSITNYMYHMVVYNRDRTHHHKSAFIVYNSEKRMYYVYSIISNGPNYQSTRGSVVAASAESSLDDLGGGVGGGGVGGDDNESTTLVVEPINTIQTRFSCYVAETIEQYVMTMLVPSIGKNYYIQDQIIGILLPRQKMIFDNETTYYDVERLLYDTSSSETTNGHIAFPLIPYREYSTDSIQYTQTVTQSTLLIISQSV